MRRWEQLLRAPKTGAARSGTITFQDWANVLLDGQFTPHTWGNLSEEQLSQTATSAYRNNGPVFALTLARLQIFSQARFQWATFDKGQEGDLFGSPELRVLERPWHGGTTADLLARMEMHVSTAGNAYVRRTRRPGLDGDRLHMLPPEWVTIVMGSHEDADHPAESGDVEVIGYVYKPGGWRANNTARAVGLLPHEVAHYAPIPDPNSRFLGMSWITPVLRDTQADDASTLHKAKFFQHAATPNLAIKFDPTIKLAQIKEFKAMLEEEHAGSWNAYKTLYLGGGADVTTVGKDFKELDFSATQGKGESRLASAAGVPPSWVGFSEGLQGSALNAGNFNAARRRMGDGTMRHLWGNAAATLETVLRRPPGDTVHLTYASRDIPFLREDSKDASEVQSREASTISGLVKEGFTAESAIAAVLNSDWSLLVHSGLLSVQLQPPGTTAAPTSATPATTTEE